MLTLALCLLAAPRQVAQIETILNGDFDRHVTQIGTSLEIYGSYWIGAEGVDADTSNQYVVDSSGNRVLRISSSTENVISQRVPLPIPQTDGSCPGSPGGAESDVELAFTLKGAAASSAYLSVLEDSGYHTAFHWKVLPGIYYRWDATAGDYVGALEDDDRLTAWEPLQQQRISTSGCSSMDIDASGFNFHSTPTGNGYNNAFATVSPGYALQAVWTAPYDGIVRVYDRPAPFVATQANPAGAPNSFRHEIYHDPDPTKPCVPSTSPLSSVVVADFAANPDRDGILVTERILDVEEGDRIIFRLANDVVTGSGAGTIKVQWHPALRYESYCPGDAGDCSNIADVRGRRVTYVAAPSLTGLTPMLGETFEYLGASTGSPVTYSGLKPLQLSGDRLGDARGALDVILGSFDTAYDVDFDDVSCLVDFDHVANAGELIEQVLEDITASRDNELYIRDRDETHDSLCGNVTGYPGQGGSVETPWSIHRINVDSGPRFEFLPGGRPAAAARRQEVSTDARDFLDLDFIDEANAQRSDTTTWIDTGDKYDGLYDIWSSGPAEVSIDPREHLDRYLELGDVEELRRALEQSYAMSQNGVVNATGDDRNGLILSKGYDPTTGGNAYTGTTADVDAHWDPWLGMDPPAAMVQTVVACLNAKAANSNLSSFLDGAKMEAVWEAAKVAATKAADLKAYHEPTHTSGEWEGTWMYLGGYFNDTYGYGSKASWPAVYALDSLSGEGPYTTTKSAMKSVFYNAFILDGAFHFLDLWEQATCRYGPAAADEMRAWESYAKLYDYVHAQAPSHPILADLRRVAHEAALNALKFQYAADGPGGVWFNSNHEDFQMTEIVGPFGGFSYGPELALSGGAIALHSLDGTAKADMLDLMSTVSRATNLNFGREFGHAMGVVPLFNEGIASPVEGRILGAKVWLIDAVKPAAVLPTVDLSIDDLDSVPASLDFTLTAPSGTLGDVIDERLIIGYWSFVSGQWTWTPLWEDGVGPLLSLTLSPPSAQFTLAGSNLPSGDVKFRIVAWTEDGERAAKSSYQEW